MNGSTQKLIFFIVKKHILSFKITFLNTNNPLDGR